MYAYIRGILAETEEDAVVVEAGGIGYRIYTTGQTYGALPPVGGTVRIYTYQQVREDAVLLFGFLTKDELRIFKLLIGVSGIGPKGALAILSVMTTDDLRFAVLGEDAKAIARAPGVGVKTAQRLILELRDKLNMDEAAPQGSAAQPVPQAGAKGAKSEAVQALTALGYSSSEALKAVNEAEVTDETDVEEILKAALKNMALF